MAGRGARHALSTTRPHPTTTYVLLWPDDHASARAIEHSNRRRGFRRTPRAQQLRHLLRRALLPAHRRK